MPSFAMRNTIVMIVFSAGLAVGAVSQNRKPETLTRPSEPEPNWEKGTVEGRTYKNASVGIELTPPPGLELGDPELRGTLGTVPLLVTITALGEYRLPRSVLSFYADALAYYPSTQRSTEAYMRKVVRSQQNDGYEPVDSAPRGELGGVTFARKDFKKGIVYESVLVRACEAQSFVFMFGGADQETVDKLNAATELKLDPVTSGCR